jgi:hypothetical protein
MGYRQSPGRGLRRGRRARADDQTHDLRRRRQETVDLFLPGRRSGGLRPDARPFRSALDEIGQPLQERTCSIPSAPPDRSSSLSIPFAVPNSRWGWGALWNTRPFSPSVLGAWTSGPSSQAQSGEDLAWYDPQDLGRGSPLRRSCPSDSASACRRCSTTSGRYPSTDKEFRPVEAGDILILVRSRSPLFRQIIAALKAHDLPIAGVDRARSPLHWRCRTCCRCCVSWPRPRMTCPWPRSFAPPSVAGATMIYFALHMDATGTCGEPCARAPRSAPIGPPHMPCCEICVTQSDFKRPYDLLERALCGTMHAAA